MMKMTEYSLQHRRMIAEQVLEPEQLVDFLVDHAEMENQVSLTGKQEVLKTSQVCVYMYTAHLIVSLI